MRKLLMVLFLSGCCGGGSFAPAPVASHPEVSQRFEGAGAQVSEAFTLYQGAAFVSVQHAWPPGGSEHFAVKLQRLDGGYVIGGLVTNEVSTSFSPLPAIDTRQLVQVRDGTYLISTEADPGSPWAVQVLQPAQ